MQGAFDEQNKRRLLRAKLNGKGKPGQDRRTPEMDDFRRQMGISPHDHRSLGEIIQANRIWNPYHYMHNPDLVRKALGLAPAAPDEQTKLEKVWALGMRSKTFRKVARKAGVDEGNYREVIRHGERTEFNPFSKEVFVDLRDPVEACVISLVHELTNNAKHRKLRKAATNVRFGKITRGIRFNCCEN